MIFDVNETHDPALRSWIDSAEDPATDFPIQNLPYCLFERDEGEWRLGVAIGDRVVDLSVLAEAGLLTRAGETDDPIAWATQLEAMNLLMALDPDDWTALRARLSGLLRHDEAELRDDADLRAGAVIAADSVRFDVPAEIGDYTDFYASVFHATNVGSMFRPDNPLLPNYKHIPVGYHGRSSSIVASGTPVRRPRGQLRPSEDAGPGFGPCRMLDYELEVGVFVGTGNDPGKPIPIAEASRHAFGICLLNDWSARDMQKWEYQPLGPFLAKSFASTLSPFVVTMEALAPFRAPAFERPAGDPAPLPYLDDEADRAAGGIDLTLEVQLASAEMRRRNKAPVTLSRGTFRDMYWTVAQMIAHHSSNGCNLRPGDLLGSGTVSGRDRGARGCLLELTWDGDPWASPPDPKPGTARTPITLPTGEERRFLEDGDEVILRGWCERDGFRRIGLGECRGIIEPANP